MARSSSPETSSSGESSGGESSPPPQKEASSPAATVAAAPPPAAAPAGPSMVVTILAQHGTPALAGICVLLSWVLGSLGAPAAVSIAAVTALLFWTHAKLQELTHDAQHVEAEKLHQKSNKGAKRGRRESAVWLSDLLGKVWPYAAPYTEKTVVAAIEDQVAVMLGKKAKPAPAPSAEADEGKEAAKEAEPSKPERQLPAWIENVEVAEFSLGLVAPRINWFRCTRTTQEDLSGDVRDVPAELRGLLSPSAGGGKKGASANAGPLPLYILEVDFEFPSEFRMVVNTVFGTRWFSVPVPISITDFSAAGTVKLRMDLTQEMPFVKTLGVRMASPRVDVGVRPLLMFDLLRLIPGFHSIVQRVVQDAIANLDLDIPLIRDSQEAHFAKVAHKRRGGQRGMFSAVPGASMFGLDEDSEDEDGLATGPQKVGDLVLKVLAGRQLPAMDRGNRSDPFCVVHFGKETEKTAVVKRTLSPTWTETFEFPVFVDAKREIKVEMFDWDAVGDNDFMGEVVVDFTDYPDDEPQTFWAPLKTRNGRTIDKAPDAEVKLQVSFFAE
jgi:Ca2+-dependent lipid-binding protein